jgi:hypothetical protein
MVAGIAGRSELGGSGLQRCDACGGNKLQNKDASMRRNNVDYATRAELEKPGRWQPCIHVMQLWVHNATDARAAELLQLAV